jgi:hypothetical protein
VAIALVVDLLLRLARDCRSIASLAHDVRVPGARAGTSPTMQDSRVLFGDVRADLFEAKAHNNNSTDRTDRTEGLPGLASNWKSALSVVGLHEGYVRLQQENHHLTAELQDAKTALEKSRSVSAELLVGSVFTYSDKQRVIIKFLM